MLSDPQIEEYMSEARSLVGELRADFEQFPDLREMAPSTESKPIALQEVIDRTVAEGILTSEEITAIDQTADEIVQVFESPDDTTMVADEEDAFSSVFGRLYVEHLALSQGSTSRRRIRGFLKDEKRPSIQGFRRFFTQADAISLRGKPILDKRFVENLSSRPTELGSDHDINVLKALALIDLLTSLELARPTLMNSKSAQKERTPEAKREVVDGSIAGLLDGASRFVADPSDKAFDAHLRIEARDQMKGRLIQRVPKEVQIVFDGINDSLNGYMDVVRAEAQLGLADNHKRRAKLDDRGEVIQKIVDKGNLLNLAFQHIGELVEKELVREPSTETLLGALAIENWRADLVHGLGRRLPFASKTIDARKWFAEWEAKPLHVALSEAEEEAKRQQAREAVETINAQIELAEDGYRFTAKGIREIDPGLNLSRSLMNIKDNGHNSSVFSSHEARQLAGLLLTLKKPEEFESLHDTLNTLGELHQQRKALDRTKRQPQLFSIINRLRELNEAGIFDNNDEWLIVKQWLRKLDEPDAVTELDSEIVSAPEAELISEPEEPKTVEPELPAEMKELVAEPISDPVPEVAPSYLPIQPFPPEKTDIVKDIETAVKESGEGYIVQWERIEQFLTLYSNLQEAGHDVQFWRTRHSNWHPLPYYAIEISPSVKGFPPIAIVESPIYGNATYFMEDEDWREMVQMPKQDARTLGAMALRHPDEDAGLDESYHTDKLFKMIPKY